MRASTNDRYLARIERVVDALLTAPAEAHSVESLAALAHMSEYHFHRMFRALMGETVLATMRRVRLAYAADRLAGGAESVARIAHAAGYESPQAFARAFRSYTRSTPGEFRRRHRRMESAARPCFAVGEVDLVDEPACEAFGWRHDGSIATIPSSVRRFWQWQLRRALLPRVRCTLGVVYPDAADPRGFRYFAAVVADAPDRVIDDATRLTLPGGRYARYVLHGPASAIAPAFRAMQRDWLPHSGFALDDRPLIERYVEPCSERTQGDEAVTELLIPIRARRSCAAAELTMRRAVSSRNHE
ncbi:MAG TPA: GyrI-like domain-containing protein [Pseudomonadales bacterium]|nr:GyrI-like domain-containing protein [Pseudomonadales bacterium]